MDVTRLPAVCADDRNARCLPEAAKIKKRPFGRAGPNAPHCKQPRWRTPLKRSGVDHVFRVVVRVQPASTCGLLEVARHGVGCPTANCFTGGTISTIANHRQPAFVAPRYYSCLESQPAAPSVRAMDRRGLVNPPCGRYRSFKSLARLRGRHLW
jgi:hypothetical protein